VLGFIGYQELTAVGVETPAGTSVDLAKIAPSQSTIFCLN
jgi:hypothetical protein